LILYFYGRILGYWIRGFLNLRVLGIIGSKVDTVLSWKDTRILDQRKSTNIRLLEYRIRQKDTYMEDY
jgi:hypothetical protein